MMLMMNASQAIGILKVYASSQSEESQNADVSGRAEMNNELGDRIDKFAKVESDNNGITCDGIDGSDDGDDLGTSSDEESFDDSVNLHHHQWTTTTSNTTNQDIHELNEFDVVTGRSKFAHSHPGNRRFRAIIQEYREAYQCAKLRQHKKKLAQGIINVIHQSGGRFVKIVNNHQGYDCGPLVQELSQGDRHCKVSHALRSARVPVAVASQSKQQTTAASILDSTTNDHSGSIFFPTNPLTSHYDSQQNTFNALHCDHQEHFVRDTLWESSPQLEVNISNEMIDLEPIMDLEIDEVSAAEAELVLMLLDF
jgi:hypothetical protein